MGDIGADLGPAVSTAPGATVTTGSPENVDVVMSAPTPTPGVAAPGLAALMDTTFGMP